MKQRKICVVTTSRADYGLFCRLMEEIRSDRALRLQVIASGAHLSPEFGMTCQILERDGWRIDKKVEMLLAADSETAAVKSLGVALIGFSDALAELKPDLLVLLGDRYELLAPAIAALLLKIRVAHLYGGETTQGAIDESVRHAITKIASVHFPAAEPYRRRIIQMGEDPGRVFNYGSVGLDNFFKQKLLTRAELSDRLELDLDRTTAIVTYHPETLDVGDPLLPMKSLLEAVDMAMIQAVFTMANADPHGKALHEMVQDFCRRDPARFKLFNNLGQVDYLSCIQHLALMIGNSSSGLTEAPSQVLPVVNVGDRQKGRLRARNVIDCPADTESILKAIRRAISGGFRRSLRGMRNPYQKYRDGRTAWRIKEKLKRIDLKELPLKKRFYDLDV